MLPAMRDSWKSRWSAVAACAVLAGAAGIELREALEGHLDQSLPGPQGMRVAASLNCCCHSP